MTQIDRTTFAQAAGIDLPKVDGANAALVERLSSEKAGAAKELALLIEENPAAGNAVLRNALYQLGREQSVELARALDHNYPGGLAALPKDALLAVDAELAAHIFAEALNTVPGIGRVAWTGAALGAITQAVEAQAKTHASKMSQEMLENVKTVTEQLRQFPGVDASPEERATWSTARGEAIKLADVGQEQIVLTVRARMEAKGTEADLREAATKLLKAADKIQDYQKWLATEGVNATFEQRTERFKQFGDQVNSLSKGLGGGLATPQGKSPLGR